MKIYFDTEFTSLDGFLTDIRLISAGFVAESGEEFYFELTNHYEEGECSSFVCEAVLPHLDHAKYGMTAPEACSQLKNWIESFKDQIELCSDAPGYDWGFIYELFESNDSWPTNLTRKPLNVNNHAIQQGIESYFECQPIPQGSFSSCGIHLLAIRHHALWDARALAAAVKAYEAGIRY